PQCALREPVLNKHSEWNVATENSLPSGGGMFALISVAPNRSVLCFRGVHGPGGFWSALPIRGESVGVSFLQRDSRTGHVSFPLAELAPAVIPFVPEPRPAATAPIYGPSSLPPST